MSVINFKSNKKDCWGKRFKNALSNIDTPYILPILDDFVLKERIDDISIFEKVMNWMDENENIGCFYLHKHPFVIQKETQYPGFGLLPSKCDYKMTTAIGVWRKEYLNKCIKGIESPWEWERFASERAWRFSEEEYALLNGEKDPYIHTQGGVLWRGLWHPEAKELARSFVEGIQEEVRDAANFFMLEDDI